MAVDIADEKLAATMKVTSKKKATNASDANREKSLVDDLRHAHSERKRDKRPDSGAVELHKTMWRC